MKLAKFFHFPTFGPGKVQNGEKHNAKDVPKDTDYQGAWTGGDGSRPKHDAKTKYHCDQGYFSKKTQVASDKAYQQAWV
eukprot:CAMPEP_0178732372 /NCGR_PEP_ID=MMETSP0744-20121128/227_1 /TAXON_ID=913974 /ORGANISM="Nitzschia punctata, Strain CCMP561" /LENGTH=78 /DNA_ID=CAMNT_0020384485 /DNA_START=197 /DNA_END=433 /DNA_ORIENTATION=+